MSDDESDSLDASQLIDSTAEEGPSVRSITATRRRWESCRSHLLFLGIMLAVAVVVLVVGLSVGLASTGSDSRKDPMTRAKDLLAEYPVIDGSVIPYT